MHKKVERDCPSCGVTYLADPARIKHGRQTTCSRKCSYLLRGSNLERRVEGVCATCGQEFSRPPSHVKGKHGSQFCTPACHYAGRSLGLTQRVVTEPYRYTDASIAALSQAAARSYATGVTRPYPQTELAAAALLARHGVAHIHQWFTILPNERGVAVDFLIPNRRLCIEVDGPEHRQRRKAARDAERDELLGQMGYVVRRIRDDGIPEHVARATLIAAVSE